MDETVKKQRSTIYQVYFVFLFTIFCSFIPNTGAQILAALLFLVLIIFVPLYRHAAPKGSLLESHMGYLNVTIWMGSLFLMVSVLIMGFWVYQQSDQSVFHELFERINQGALIGEDEIYGAANSFMQENMGLLVKASVICIGPPALYIAIRVFRALSRAQGISHGMGLLAR